MKLLKFIKNKLYIQKILWKRKSFRKKILQTLNVKIHSSCSGYTKVNFQGDNGIPENCQFLGNDIQIGYKSTLGRNNLLSGKITIGKYCQIGADVALHASDHPMSYMTTYINHKLFAGELKGLKMDHKITVGNDVWIGHGVIIVGNVSIGNGAILAAGSVVTKNVPVYAVVGGVPAKVIKYRFNATIIDEIEKLKWWDMNDSQIEELKPLFFKDFKNKESIYE